MFAKKYHAPSEQVQPFQPLRLGFHKNRPTRLTDTSPYTTNPNSPRQYDRQTYRNLNMEPLKFENQPQFATRPRLRSDFVRGHSNDNRPFHPKLVNEQSKQAIFPISERLSQRINEIGQQIFVLSWKNQRRLERLSTEISNICGTYKEKIHRKREPSQASVQYSRIDTLRKLKDEEEEETQFGSTCMSAGYSAHAYLNLDDNPL